MSRRSSYPLCAALLLSAAASAQDSLPKGAELMDRVQARYGAPQALAKVRNRVFEGQAYFAGMEGKGSVKEILAGPGQSRIEVDFPGFGRIEQGTGEGVVWEMHSMAPGAEIKTGNDATVWLRIYATMRNHAWRELYEKAECVGKETIGEREAYKVVLMPLPLALEVDDDGGTVLATTSIARGVDGASLLEPDVQYVDVETLLPVRFDVEMKGAMGAMTMQTEPSEWREVDGVLYPFVTRHTAMGFTQVKEYESIRHNVELAVDTFALPRKVLETAKAGYVESAEFGRDITVASVDEKHVACIRYKVKPAELGASMAIKLPEIMMYLTSQDARVAGPPYSRYYSVTDEEIELECGMPVSKPVAAKGHIQPGTLPGGAVVSAWHVGPYEELVSTHEAVKAWITAEELEATGAPWEIYWTDPGMEADPAKWRTQILVPIAE